MTARDRHLPVPYAQGYTRLCREGCGARIWLCPLDTGGGWVALNLEPSETGNVVLDGHGRARVLAGPPADGETAYLAHQATCPPYLERQRRAAHDHAQLRLGDDA